MIFLAGVLGSMHCVGMCGAIVLAYSTVPGGVPAQPSLRSGAVSHLVYNGGRVLSYTLIGALAGFLGGVLGTVQSFGTWFSLAAGVVMVGTGLVMLGLLPRLTARNGGREPWMRRLHVDSISGLLSLRTIESKFYIGLLTPFLPCGLLYSMFVKAAATGTALEGAWTMLLFGSGIVPALFITGWVSAYIGLTLRHYANRLAAVTIIIMGVTMIMRGAGMPLPFMGGHEGHAPRVESTGPSSGHLH